MRFLLAALLFALLAVTPTAHAQAPPDDPLGYVNPRVVEGWFDAPPTVEVNLRGTLLRMVAQAAEQRDDGRDADQQRAAALMKRLSAIHVRIFEAPDVSMNGLETRTTELTERLNRQGWETVVRVREPEEQVSVQLRSRDADTVAGLVVLVNSAQDGESVFVNIVGDISPEELGQLTGSLGGLDGLDRLDGLGSDSSSRDGTGSGEDSR